MSSPTNSNYDKHSEHHSHSSGEHRSHHSSSHHHHHSSSHHHHSSSHHHHHSSGHHHSGSHSHRHSSHSSGHSDYYYSDSPTSSMNSERAQEKIRQLSEKYDEISTPVKSQPMKRTPKAPSAGKKKKKKSMGKIILGVVVFFLLLVLVAVVTLFIMINSGKKNLLDYEDTTVEAVEEAEIEDDGKTVRYNGKIYRLNENITSIACLGVDKKGIVNSDELIGNQGQADTLIIIAFDTETGKTKLLSIPRDTVAEVDIYDTKGSFVRVEETQICLAYAYGDGGKTSCENVVASLQKLLFGIPIRSYAALDIKGIGALNDAVGGVTVTPEETFGYFKTGQSIKLKGDMAMDFVRYRDHERVDANLYRMERQKQYIRAFARTGVEKIGTDVSAITDLYNTAMKYGVTNVGLNDVSYLAVSFVTKANGKFDTLSTPGKMVEGEDKHAEYHIDETAFYETILSIYYNVIGTY
ncbi:MAG: LCP family protein [Clostridia bacterium]|nr:LCP family protein [Clostridia bacterium]